VLATADLTAPAADAAQVAAPTGYGAAALRDAPPVAVSVAPAAAAAAAVAAAVVWVMS